MSHRFRIPSIISASLLAITAGVGLWLGAAFVLGGSPRSDAPNGTAVTGHTTASSAEASLVPAPVDHRDVDRDRATTSPPPSIAAWSTWIDAWRSDASAVDLDQGIAIATRRRGDMQRLIAHDPEAALAHAIEPAVRAELPPAVQRLIELPIDTRGDLECIASCGMDHDAHDHAGHEHRIEVFARIDDRVYRTTPFGRRSGVQTVRDVPIRGIALGDQLAMYDEPLALVEPDASAATIALAPSTKIDTSGKSPWTVGEKRLLVVLCRPTDAPEWTDPPTASQLEAQLAKTSDWYRSVSWGQTWFHPEVTVTPVLDLPRDSGTYRPSSGFSTLYSDCAGAASAAGYPFSQFDRVVAMSNLNLTSSSGRAYVGGKFLWAGSKLDGGIAVHEFGHTWGLRHASVWDSPDADPRSRDGMSIEYGDKRDAMGSTSSGPFNISYRHRLHWATVGDTGVRWIEAGGRYRIYNQLEAERILQRSYGIAILLSPEGPSGSSPEPRDHAREFLWLGYRHDERFQNQLQLHTQCQPFAYSNQQHRLDMRPDTATLDDACLPLGQSFVDTDNAHGTLSVTPVATGSEVVDGVVHEWIEVEVVLGGDVSPPTNAAPAVDAGGDRQIGFGETVLLAASVSDDGLPADGNLTVAWSVASGPGAVVFSAPDASSTSASFSQPGTYVLRLSADDGALSSADTLSVTVAPPPVAQAPYGGQPHAVPGRIEAEAYDLGGPGVAYHDTSSANQGGDMRSDAVDIQRCSDVDGVYNVGWMDQGEWLAYTVSVAQAGTYRLDLRVARPANTSGGLELRGEQGSLTGAIAIADTGGWQAWQTVSREVELAAGTQVLRLAVTGSGVNCNWFALSPLAPDPDGGSGAIQEQDGLVVIEATDADRHQPSDTHSWNPMETGAGAVGGALEAGPNTGTNHGDRIVGARLAYDIDFATTGTWYAWIRAWGPSGTDDSCHLGLDGAPATYGRYGMGTTVSSWTWLDRVDGRPGEDRVTIEVATAGRHALDVWMREDGFRLDQIVLTTDPAYRPSGDGPPVSPRGTDGGQQPPSPGTIAVAINFQPAGAAVPAGFLADTSQPFAARDGHSYGWTTSFDETRDRNRAPDQEWDTLNHVQRGGHDRTWEIALPAGLYRVRIGAGDAAYTDQVNHLLVEGVALRDPDGEDHFDEWTELIQVDDGRLTLAPAADASNAKLCFIVIDAAGTNQ